MNWTAWQNRGTIYKSGPHWYDMLTNMISSICSFDGQHTWGLTLTNVYTSYLYQNLQHLHVFPGLCLWLPWANFNGERSAAIQRPYKVNAFFILTTFRNWRNRLELVFSTTSLSERSHVSGKPPCIFHQGNTESQPFLPPPFLIKILGLFLFVFLCHKRVRAPLVYPRFFSSLMHWHISI